MRRFAVLLVLCLLGGNAFAACSGVLTSESAAIAYAGTGAIKIVVDADSYSNPWAWSTTTTGCSGSTTRWYADSTKHVYRKVVSCTSCPSSSNLTTAKVAVGDCVYDFNICDRCSTVTTPSIHAASLGTYGPDSGCSSYETRYVEVPDGDDSYYEIRSCTSCNSGYHMITNSSDSGECSTSYVSCERCTAGTYINYATEGAFGYCVDCAVGTYNGQTEATSCETCPTIHGMSTTTSGTGTSYVGYCCVSSGTTATDSTGTYTIDPLCCDED